MDWTSMIVLTGLMLGFAYFALRNVRQQLDNEWEREFLMRDRFFRCAQCEGTFEFVEYVDSPFSEAECPYCGSTDTRAWMADPADELIPFEWEPSLPKAVPASNLREVVGTASSEPQRKE
jgi:DNA-directed RNA polymerase subunit RPC12/RpoP